MDTPNRMHCRVVDARCVIHTLVLSLTGLHGSVVLAGQPSGRVSALRARLAQREDAHSQNELAKVLYSEGEVLEARAMWDRAAKSDPNYPGANIAVATQLIAKREIDAAKVALQRAERENPKDPHVYLTQAALAVHQRDYHAADQALRRALQLNERLAVTHVRKGKLHELQRQTERAERCYREAVSLEPDYPSACLHLARLRFLRGDISESKSLLERLDELAPTGPHSSARLASFHANVNDLIGARALYMEALKKRPHATELRVAFANVLAALNRFDEVRATLETAPHGSESVEVMLQLAMLNERQNRESEAIAGYERILTQQPKHWIAANNLAMALVKQRRAPQRALDLAKLAVEQSDSHSHVFATLACALYEAGHDEEAIRILPKAIRQLPADAWLRYAWGCLLKKQGRYRDGYTQLEGCLILDPQFARQDEVRGVLAELSKQLEQ